jgi:hypothetical protein
VLALLGVAFALESTSPHAVLGWRIEALPRAWIVHDVVTLPTLRNPSAAALRTRTRGRAAARMCSFLPMTGQHITYFGLNQGAPDDA